MEHATRNRGKLHLVVLYVALIVVFSSLLWWAGYYTGKHASSPVVTPLIFADENSDAIGIACRPFFNRRLYPDWPECCRGLEPSKS